MTIPGRIPAGSNGKYAGDFSEAGSAARGESKMPPLTQKQAARLIKTVKSWKSVTCKKCLSLKRK